MRFTYAVNVEVERDSGPFASRDEIGEQVQEALEGADYGEWSGDAGGAYSTTDFDVEEVDQAEIKKAARAARKAASA